MSKPTSVLKWGPKKGKQEGGKIWLHSPEAISNGSVVYAVKFLGVTDVPQAKGTDVVKDAIKKLKFANHIKRSEAGVKGSKLKKVEIVISIDYVKVQDVKTKELLYTYPLHRISYCADDKSDKKLFAFIAKDKSNPQHACFVFESDKLAEELTLSVGQAFDLAYKRFLQSQGMQSQQNQGNQQAQSNQGQDTKQITLMQKHIQEAEAEKEALKQKIAQLETQVVTAPQQNLSQPNTTSGPSPTAVPINVQTGGQPQQDSSLLNFGTSPFSNSELSSKTVEDLFDPLTDFSSASQPPQTQTTQNQNVQPGFPTQTQGNFGVQVQNGFQSQASFGMQPQVGLNQSQPAFAAQGSLNSQAQRGNPFAQPPAPQPSLNSLKNNAFDPFNDFNSQTPIQNSQPQVQNQPQAANPFGTDIFSASMQQPQQSFTPAQPQVTAVARPAGSSLAGGISALPPPPGRQRPPAKGAQPAAFTAAPAQQAVVSSPFGDSFVPFTSSHSYSGNDLADLQEGFAKGLQLDNISCGSYDILDG